VPGEAVNHAASLDAEKLSAPEPVFETARLAGCGSGPPVSAPRLTALGVTLRTAPVPAAVLAYAEIGELLHEGPGDHVAGSAVRLVWLLFCERVPLAASLKARLPLPEGERTLNQYVVPAVTETPETAAVFQDPAAGVEIVACVRSDPGLPPLSAYRPTITFVAFDPLSRYTLSDPTAPDDAATAENASALPALLLSLAVETVCVPSSTAPKALEADVRPNNSEITMRPTKASSLAVMNA
jgi:hypothetical protein